MANKLEVGYDLDGVLCPDIDIGATVNKQLHGGALIGMVVHARQLMMPMFHPADERFAVITGRPCCDLDLTRSWLHTHFEGRFTLTHNSGDGLGKWESAVFKAKAIAAMGLKVFVESDAAIAAEIADMSPGVKVIVFQEVARKLHTL